MIAFDDCFPGVVFGGTSVAERMRASQLQTLLKSERLPRTATAGSVFFPAVCAVLQGDPDASRKCASALDEVLLADRQHSDMNSDGSSLHRIIRDESEDDEEEKEEQKDKRMPSAAVAAAAAAPRARTRGARAAATTTTASSSRAARAASSSARSVAENLARLEEEFSEQSEASSADWSMRYRRALRAADGLSDDDDDTVAVDLSAPIAGFIYVANDTLQQHRPAGFMHRYECGFSTVPVQRLRNFFTHNLDIRWMLTVPVTDVLAANRAALATLTAAGARIIPGRIKWFTFPRVDVQDWKDSKAAALPVAVSTRMILDWIRAAVQPWFDGTRRVHYGAGPAQHVQAELLALYQPDAFGDHILAPAVAAVMPLPAAPAAAAHPVAAAAALALRAAAPVVVHVSANPVRVAIAPLSEPAAAAVRSAASSAHQRARSSMPDPKAAGSDAAPRRFQHGRMYDDDFAGDADGDDEETVAVQAENAVDDVHAKQESGMAAMMD